MNLNDEYVKWCKEYDKLQGNHRFKAELLAYNAFKAGFKVGAAPLNQEVAVDTKPCQCVGWSKHFPGFSFCSDCGRALSD